MENPLLTTQLTPHSDNALATAYSVLAKTRAESLWLANYTSANTRMVYRNAVADFLATMGIDICLTSALMGPIRLICEERVCCSS